MNRIGIRLCGVSLLLAGMAGAQTITGAMNAASRLPRGLPNSAIARGAVFVVTGTALGPDEKQTAGFPLPIWDGLGGSLLLVSNGPDTVAPPLVYSSATEVAAIMPSNAPLGNVTLYLVRNDQWATYPITVVEAGFGIFTHNGTGRGAALAFNATDHDPVLNTIQQPATPGQTVLLNGTGAGAIGADETQTGITDPVSTSFQVWVGNRPATVVSAGRMNCCTGLDANYPIPRGLAGWDVIQFTVPEGVSGCHVPVAVQSGNIVSNFATIAVAPFGLPCTDPTGFSGADLQPYTGPVKVGAISLNRGASRINIPGMSMDIKSDTGSAAFLEFDAAAVNALPDLLRASSVGGCTVVAGTPDSLGQWSGPLPKVLDAGGEISITGNGVTRQMQKRDGGTYSANFGTGISLPFFLPGAQAPFLEPGAFSAGNDSGGADVGAFNASVSVPRPLTWTNQDSIANIDRSQGVTVTWAGGGENSYVTIWGTSANKDAAAMFVCTEQAGAGQFTVPATVTMSLPESAIDTTTGAQLPTGLMNVGSTSSGKFVAPGIDLGYFMSSVSAMKNLNYR